MVDNWNECVKPEDTIYHLGDVAMGSRSNLEIVRQLNGHKILIRGNHDRSIAIMKEYFDEVYDSQYLQIRGQWVLLKHKPMEARQWVAPIGDKYISSTYQICGHVHDKWKRVGNIINVGVDVRDFKPVSWAELEEEILHD